MDHAVAVQTARIVGVADAHVFTAALGIAVDLFEYGYTEPISRDAVGAIVGTSFLGFSVNDFRRGAGYSM